jgi:hypothetical protein
MYILKLLLDVVTAGLETLVVSGYKLLYGCVKEVCRLWAQPRFYTSNPLLVIVEALWLQPVLQVGKQVVVARSEIRDLRRVVKQLPVEMLQQCLSGGSCMRTCIVMEKYYEYTVCQHSMPFFPEWPHAIFFVFRNTLLTLLWSHVA